MRYTDGPRRSDRDADLGSGPDRSLRRRKSLKALAVDVIEAWNTWAPEAQDEGEYERLLEAIDALAAKVGMKK